MVGCSNNSNNTIYSQYAAVPDLSWHQDSVFNFTFEVEDTIGLYDIFIDIRHTDAYPYQNMWLFVRNNMLPTRDTLEFFLADDHGRWLGNGLNGLVEMPVIYEDGYRFPKLGTCQIAIMQGMRETYLKGVNDVGIIIKKHGQE